PELALILKSLCNHGRDGIYLNIDDDQGVSRERLFEIVARRFSFVRLGHSLRGTEMEAALGLAQLEEREAMLTARRRNAAVVGAGLADLGDRLALPPHPVGRDHAYMMYPLRVSNTGGRRQTLVNFLEESGIETRDLFPLLTQPVYRTLFGELAGHYPV